MRYSEALPGIERVAISGFSNETMEAGIDSLVTDAITREFMQRGALRLVDEPGAADLVMTGLVTEVDTRNRSYSSVAFALEYEVRLQISVTLERKDGTKILFDGPSLGETERYLASADVETTRTNREEALRRLAGILAARVHERVRQLRGHWKGTPYGGEMELDWPEQTFSIQE